MQMVTDTELAEKVHEFLQNSDLKKTTVTIVLKKLESEYGVDLSDKKPFIRYQVGRFLEAQYEVLAENEEYEVPKEVEDDDDDDYSNDDVSDDVDGFIDAVPANNNIGNGSDSFNLKDVDTCERSGQQNKEKKQKTCMSGRYSTLSPKLQKFLGVAHMTRAEVVKQLWIYVKGKKLQDPTDGKTIICDGTLRDLFEVDSINILQINKALTNHIFPPVKPSRKYKRRKQEKDEETPSVKSLPNDKPWEQELPNDKPWEQELPNDKPRKQGRKEDACEDATEEKRQKKVYCGFLPLPMSDTLIKFLDSGETALTRADVIKRLWEYIKLKNLQDPSDKKTVICDEKLKELLNVDTFHGFSVSKLLSPHFLGGQGNFKTSNCRYL